MTNQDDRLKKTIWEKKRKLDRKIESMGWALFLIWSGALLIAPDEIVPRGLWLTGTGLIIIGSMGIRYLYGIKIDGFWTILGFLALGFGISEFFDLNLPVFPVLLIIAGLIIGYNVFFRKTGPKREFWPCFRRRRDYGAYCSDWRDFWKSWRYTDSNQKEAKK
jgi:hypothetical protein